MDAIHLVAFFGFFFKTWWISIPCFIDDDGLIIAAHHQTLDDDHSIIIQHIYKTISLKPFEFDMIHDHGFLY
jgi:hypothetical protein